MENNCYLIEVGVLLPKEDKDYGAYSIVYDKKNGYFDEGQYYRRDLDKAKEEARSYVEEGVENTYAVVTATYMPEDINVEDDDVCVESEDYDTDNVVFSIVKNNGELKENFVGSEVLV